MDNKTKILLALFFLLVFLASFLSYKKYFLERDYLIMAEVTCNPEYEVCFVGRCENEIDDCEEEIFYYKKIEGKANLIPGCDPNYDDCPLLWCGKGDNYTCINILCGAGDECSSPEDFLPKKGNREDESGIQQIPQEDNVRNTELR